MRRFLSSLFLFFFGVSILGLFIALTAEAALLFPLSSMQSLAPMMPDSVPFGAKAAARVQFYQGAVVSFWPTWLAMGLAFFVVWLMSARVLGNGQAKNYMARIHHLETLSDGNKKNLAHAVQTHKNFLARVDALYLRSSEGYVVVTSTGRIERLNPAAEAFFRQTMGGDISLVKRQIKDVMPGFVETGLERLLNQIVEQSAVWQGEVQLHGTDIWLSLKFISMGEGGIVMLFRDVTNNHKDDATLKTNDALLQQLVKHTPAMVAVLDDKFKVVRTSQALVSFLKGKEKDILGRPFPEIIPIDDFKGVKQRVTEGIDQHHEEDHLKLNEEEVWLTWSLKPWQDAFGQRGGYLFFMEDVSELHTVRQRITVKEEDELSLAYTDALTGLPNRQLFNDRFNMALAQAYRQLGKIALFFLDLDGFKAINDTLGHDAGDLLLKEVANRLQACVRESDTVARLGGDEFTIILHIREPKDADVVARKVIAKINEPYKLGDKEAQVSTSVGVAMYPFHGESAAELMKRADLAMYKAKTSGKNQFVYYSEELEKET